MGANYSRTAVFGRTDERSPARSTQQQRREAYCTPLAYPVRPAWPMATPAKVRARLIVSNFASCPVPARRPDFRLRASLCQGPVATLSLETEDELAAHPKVYRPSIHLSPRPRDTFTGFADAQPSRTPSNISTSHVPMLSS